MQRRLSTLMGLALGAAIIVAPSLANIGSDNIYDSAFAAKGGNGKGNSGGNGNGNGGASASAKGSGKGSSGQITTSVASTGATKKQKMSAKQLALTDPTATAHPSMLGRWNAAKPIDHPSIQAHIRNGNFNGTIGMVAAYAYAQTNYNSYQTNLAAADPAVAALATALTTAGYTTVLEYNAAVANGAASVAAIDTAIATTDTTTGVTTTLTAEQITAAEALATQGATAFSDLSSAEANMESWSNRSEWSVIRDDVRMKMGLDPMENDLVATTPTDPVTTTP